MTLYRMSGRRRSRDDEQPQFVEQGLSNRELRRQAEGKSKTVDANNRIPFWEAREILTQLLKLAYEYGHSCAKGVRPIVDTGDLDDILDRATREKLRQIFGFSRYHLEVLECALQWMKNPDAIRFLLAARSFSQSSVDGYEQFYDVEVDATEDTG